MAKKNVFVSYDYETDKHYKNLLIAWDANREIDFYLEDRSADVSINSMDSAAIKRAISAKISASTYFLCIVGAKTHQSKWVNWEIEKATELGKRLVAVKIDKANTSPSGLINSGATWALTFSFNSITKAIADA